MSVVSYDGVEMDLVKTHGVSREIVLCTDRTTYLHTRWAHEFTALLSPESISFLGDNPRRGQLPHITDAAIRHRLSQPRRTYSWRVGVGPDSLVAGNNGNTILSVTGETDMHHGPIVEAIDIQKMHGVGSWVIRMRIVCHVNECPEAPVILSHRWRPSVEIDEDRYATRTITGEAEFNLPRLLALSRQADNYRINFGHPVPDNFQRRMGRIVVSEDGGTINYEFTDTEKPMNLGSNCPATRVEATERYGWIGTGALGMALPIAESVFESAQRASEFSGFNLLGSARAVVFAGIRGAISKLPKFREECVVRAWGDRRSKKRDLLAFAAEIAFNRIGQFDPLAAKTSTFGAAINVVGKDVEFSLIHEYGVAGIDKSVTLTGLLGLGGGVGVGAIGAIAGALAGAGIGGANLGNFTSLAGRFGAQIEGLGNKTENINLSGGKGIKNLDRWGNPAYGVDGTRGTWLEKLVTQSLLDPCQGPSKTTMQQAWLNASRTEVTQ